MTTIVYNEDCMQGMRRYPDKYFDLAIVDPPYGINIGSSVGGGGAFGGKKNVSVGGGNIVKVTEYTGFDDTKPPSNEYFTELQRVSKNQIIWGGELLY